MLCAMRWLQPNLTASKGSLHRTAPSSLSVNAEISAGCRFCGSQHMWRKVFPFSAKNAVHTLEVFISHGLPLFLRQLVVIHLAALELEPKALLRIGFYINSSHSLSRYKVYTTA